MSPTHTSAFRGTPLTDLASQGYVPLGGKTYDVKDDLKALGGRWDPTQKVWWVPNDQYALAIQIVARGPRAAGTPSLIEIAQCWICGSPFGPTKRGARPLEYWCGCEEDDD